MRATLSDYLLAVHVLLRDTNRRRGTPPGSALERDLEAIAHSRWLRAERRVRHAAFGGAYYSGLRPETDVFVYDGPEFLQIEAKDLCGPMARTIPTEFWARSLDLHLGRAKDSLAEARKAHYPVLVASTSVSDQLRVACIRWGICLLEPERVPFPVLVSQNASIADLLQETNCSVDTLKWACRSYNERFPRYKGGVQFPFGPVRSRQSVAALLRFQRLATQVSRAIERNNAISGLRERSEQLRGHLLLRESKTTPAHS
ncbi:hypothetical protein NKI12_14285 [Mesorhizobium australicum]|uniref:Uncharacterized protein n=1 Tax=Mesorhizobium australicum TaxID=536018 RepID=A0ACC6T0H3_9HYPH